MPFILPSLLKEQALGNHGPVACYILGGGVTTEWWVVGMETDKTWNWTWDSETYHPGFQPEI